ncbi:hypothetical protein C0989_009118 [Termitomyces sp. Mn162]|nr:hypothetical protein C0989_009118 [Termitomyces sp. Mn162]
MSDLVTTSMVSTELTSADLESILQSTIQLAKTAGKLILEGSQAIQWASDNNVNEKKNAVDLVTEYDVRVEELVRKEIQEKYPHFRFQQYSGVKGQGSYLTRGSAPPLRLPLSSQPKPLPSLSKAVIAVEWGSDRCERTIAAKARSFARLAGNPVQGVTGGKMTHSLRSMGSAALNFAMVAQGGLDLYWEIGCWPWDVCAGIVIAQEAGGLVTGSHEAFAATASSSAFGDVTEEILTGRKYVVVRAISGDSGETSTDAQKRIISEFYESVEDAPTN